MKWCTQTFPPIFRLFVIFDCNSVKFVAKSSNKNENSLAHLKGQSLLKKMLETESKSTHKERHKTCSKYTPQMNSSPALEHDKKQTYKHHIFAPTAGALFDLPQTLHGGRARRAHLKSCQQPLFDPIHTFSAIGQNA